ncbi:hypothetical protein Hanom_Chr14g01278681 [Helianthus anomalus]
MRTRLDHLVPIGHTFHRLVPVEPGFLLSGSEEILIFPRWLLESFEPTGHSSGCLA